MKAIRRSFPSIIGWIAYFAYKTALSLVLVWGLYLLLRRFSAVPAAPVFLFFSLCISALSGFLGFVASAKWIVLPLIQRRKKLDHVPGVPALFVEWLLLCAGVALYGYLPLFVLRLSSTPKWIADTIAFVWVNLVALRFYLTSFSDYAKEATEQPAAEKGHPLAAV